MIVFKDSTKSNQSAKTDTIFFFALDSNFTKPEALAKSVSSLPLPTFNPGLKGVPRWRTIIEPAVTNWPPDFFYSQPFRLTIPAIFCTSA